MHVGVLDLQIDAIGEVCQEAGVRELALFGSALGDDFRADSDLDFLVEFDDDDYGPWMSKVTELQDALSELLGRRVDLVPKDQLKWVLRDRVLADARVVYAH